MSEQNIEADRAKQRHHKRVEIVSAILLALATLASAWSAYQSSRWHGVEAHEYATASAARAHSSEAGDKADQQTSLDVALFSDYCYAYSVGDLKMCYYYETNIFRPEFMVAVAAWKATDPLHNPKAPKTPFEMPEYKNANKARSAALEISARRITDEAQLAIRHADNYILLTVMFASVLFFAGISTKFDIKWLKVSLVVLGGLVFLGSTVVLFLQPIH